jgi:CRISPR-associated protein Cpf1
MKHSSIWDNFTKKYQLSKTLRFELIPVGKTEENIVKKGIIDEDERRAESYKKMKKTINGFHRHFIELAMQQVKLTHLNEFEKLYKATPEQKKEESFQTELDRVRTILRKEIVSSFSIGEAKEIFVILDKKELITVKLEEWILSQENQEIYFDTNFKTFTTYFGGFHENRKNMYTDKEQSTAIAYRLIHENLPKFIDNISLYNKAKENGLNIANLEAGLKELIFDTKLDEVFTLDNFKNTLTQKGIDLYNAIIGGYVQDSGNQKIKGVNEFINTEYNQKQKDKKRKIPKLKILYKQILSDRQSISFLPEAFVESEEVLRAIEDYYISNLIDLKTEGKDDTENVLAQLKLLLSELNSYDLNKVYLKNDTKLTNISQRIFGTYSVLADALNRYYETIEKPSFPVEYEKANEKKREKLEKEQEKFVKQPYIPIALLQTALDGYVKDLDETHEIQKAYSVNCIADYFLQSFKVEKKESTDKEFDLIANIEAKYSCIKGILGTEYPKEKKLNQDQKAIDDIKAFLDSLMELLHFVKPFSLPKDSALEKDENFYGQFEPWFEQLDLLIPLYNKVRNYATQKPYNTEKIKLNFENKAKFLEGWVDSHTDDSDNATQAGGYLFRKKNSINEYDYFVGFSIDTKLFRSHLQKEIKENDKSEYERLDYYQLKSASVYGNSYVGDSYEEDKRHLVKTIEDFAKTESQTLVEAFAKYKNRKDVDNKPTPSGLIKITEEQFPELYKKLLNDKHFKQLNTEVIEKLKQTILSLGRVPKSQEYRETDYKIFSEPIKTIEELAIEKSFSYFPVSKNEFSNSCDRDQKPLFLFKISNKDLSFAETFNTGKRKAEHRGKDNLHTMYFKALMSGSQNIYDIGTGMVFHRSKSIEEDARIVHKANRPITNKNPNTEKRQSIFKYDIEKDKRYIKEHHYQFHLSIVQNYQKPKQEKNYDYDVLKHLRNNTDVNIIGIDRGERHLIYITLINQKGEIRQQVSLNEIINFYRNRAGDNIEIKTPYHTLLDKREKERDEARKSWGTIETIKELKEGYISQVIHKIATMMVEHNAIVVMEDLNFGFKRGRFKVEKQVYQKLEKMLIDKLNYLVFKEKGESEPGGLYNALQLTNKFTSFKEMGKQNGFLFYVPAWNTSKIDPTTGFVNLFNTQYESIIKAKEFFSNFESIRFNTEKNYFEFEVKNYSSFNLKSEGTKQDWVICTSGDRIFTFRNPQKNNQWDNKTIELTKEFKILFDGIQFDLKQDLKKQIESQNDKIFFEKLLHLFKLTLQMRNSISNSEIDYLVSPVANEKGIFYDSRNKDEKLPKDADANGAYHIAKKGLWILQEINQTEDLKKLKLAISNKEWLQFAQSSVEGS